MHQLLHGPRAPGQPVTLENEAPCHHFTRVKQAAGQDNTTHWSLNPKATRGKPTTPLLCTHPRDAWTWWRQHRSGISGGPPRRAEALQAGRKCQLAASPVRWGRSLHTEAPCANHHSAVEEGGGGEPPPWGTLDKPLFGLLKHGLQEPSTKNINLEGPTPGSHEVDKGSPGRVIPHPAQAAYSQ